MIVVLASDTTKNVSKSGSYITFPDQLRAHLASRTMRTSWVNKAVVESDHSHPSTGDVRNVHTRQTPGATLRLPRPQHMWALQPKRPRLTNIQLLPYGFVCNLSKRMLSLLEFLRHLVPFKLKINFIIRGANLSLYNTCFNLYY